MKEDEKSIKRLFLDSGNLKIERVQMVKIDGDVWNMKGERKMNRENTLHPLNMKN